MRVLCIDSKPHPDTPGMFVSDLEQLHEGNVYTATGFPSPGGYFLKEIVSKNPFGFKSSRFIPCSDQENLMMEDVCETILINQKQKS